MKLLVKSLLAATLVAASAAHAQNAATGYPSRPVKLIVPLYKELAKTPAGLVFAQRVYTLAKPMYHSVARSTIEPLLAPKPAG